MIALSLAGCETTPFDSRHTQSGTLAPATDTPDCGATLPAKITWPGGSPVAPLPPPQTDTGVVLVSESFDDPATLWAFSVDAGKLTAWLAFPGYRLGDLVMQVRNPPKQLNATGSSGNFVPILTAIKIPVPPDPRLPDAVAVVEMAWLQLRLVDDALENIRVCQALKRS